MRCSANRAETKSKAMLFRQLFESESSTYTYLLADEETKEAVIIDPVDLTVARDLQLVNDLGLNLVLAINTHCHADHITGTGEIKKRLVDTNVKSGISKSAGAKADILFEPNEVIKFGSHTIKVLATPGHTAGCVSYYTESNGGLVFTGDALLIRGCGRTDFQGGSSETLFDSVHSQIFTLPPETAVYPAHDYKGQTRSSVEEERRLNPRLTKTKPEFVESESSHRSEITVAH